MNIFNVELASIIALDTVRYISKLTDCFGIAQGDIQHPRIEELISRVDQHLYLAKQQGCVRVCCEDGRLTY